MRKLGIMFIVVFGFGITGIAQEYDDMYFNSSDRKKAKKEREEELVAELQFKTEDQGNYNDGYSQTDVDPALINKYQQQAEEISLQYQSPYNSLNTQVNSSYSQDPLDFQYSGQYYEEPYYQDQYQDQGTTIINNYYGGNPGWNSGYGWGGYGNSYGWGSGWDLSFGYGYGGFGYGGWGGYGYNSWYGGYGGFGYNSWYGGYRPYYGWGYSPWRNYGGYYGNGYCYISPNTPSKQARDINRGPRTDRGGSVVNSTSQNRPLRAVSNSTNNRDYSNTQAAYLNQSGGRGSSTQPYSSGGVVNSRTTGARSNTNQSVNTRPTYSRGTVTNTQNSRGNTQINGYQNRTSKNVSNAQSRNLYYQQRQGNTVNQNRNYSNQGVIVNRAGQQQGSSNTQINNAQQRSARSGNVQQSSGTRSQNNAVRSQSSGNRSSGGGGSSSSGGGRSGGGGSSSGGGSSRSRGGN